MVDGLLSNRCCGLYAVFYYIYISLLPTQPQNTFLKTCTQRTKIKNHIATYVHIWLLDRNYSSSLVEIFVFVLHQVYYDFFQIKLRFK